MEKDNLSELEIARKKAHDRLTNNINVKRMVEGINRLNSSVLTFPFDWRFNCMLYLNDVFAVIKEIWYCYANMEAAHALYVEKVPKGTRPRNVSFLVNLEIGNILYRVFSARDKILLSYACYFDYHDPEQSYITKNLIYELNESIKKYRRDEPIKRDIIKFLDLDRKKHWDFIKKFRHMEVHRLDPKIDSYEVSVLDDWLFLKRITVEEAEKEAKSRFESGESSLKELSPKIQNQMYQEYLDNQKFESYYYEQIQPKSRLESYKNIETQLKKCLDDLVECAGDIFAVMYGLKPFAKDPGDNS